MVHLCLKVRQNQNAFFKPTFSPNNEQTKSILLLWDLFPFVFWRKLKAPKRHFEINWPLESSQWKRKNRVLQVFSWNCFLVCMNLWNSVLYPDVGIFLQKLTYPGQKTPHLNIWEIKHDGKIDPIMGRSNKNDFHTLVGCLIWMQIKLVADTELVWFWLNFQL